MTTLLRRLMAFAYGATAILAASTAISTAAADTADLAREVDVVRTAIDKALADANADKIRALQSSLKGAQEAWSRFYVGYRGWGAGTDPSWVTEIDAVQAEFMNATNAVTPGQNAPLAATSLQRIKELLAGLLDRNDVPDVDAEVKALNASLAEVQTSMKALEGKALGPQSLAALSEQWTSISESWSALNKVLIDANPLGLSERELTTLQQRMERQSTLFAAVGRALGNANLSSGLTSLNSAADGLRALASQWGVQAGGGDTAEKVPALDSRPKRRLKLR